MKYNLRAHSTELTKTLKRASIGKGKDSGYAIAITKKMVEGKFHKCTAMCGNGNMQATIGFCAQLLRSELTEDGKERVLKSPLEGTVFIYASSLLRDAVETLGAMEDKILLIYDDEGKKLEVRNTKSFLPIPIMAASAKLENPKNLKSIDAVVEKEELVADFKYVNVALGRATKSKFDYSYGLKPMVDGDKAVLHILGCDEKSASYQQVALVRMSDNFKVQCEGVAYAMLPADKLGQIITESEDDNIRFTFYYEESIAKQVNIRAGSDLYQILTKTTCMYPKGAKKIVDDAYAMFDASFQTDVGSLKSAFQVTALGIAPNLVKSVMRISNDGLMISDESGERVTKLDTGIEINLDQPGKVVTINVVNDLIMSALSPFSNEKIRVQGSNEDTDGIVSLVSGKKDVHIVIFPVKGRVKVDEVVEDKVEDKEDEDEVVITSDEGTEGLGEEE